MKKLHNGLKPISEKEMSPEARIASAAHRTATRKKRIQLRQQNLPMIIWKDGRVREVPASDFAKCVIMTSAKASAGQPTIRGGGIGDSGIPPVVKFAPCEPWAESQVQV